MNKLKLRKLILIFEINWMRKYLIKFLILCMNINILLIIIIILFDMITTNEKNYRIPLN